MSTARLKELSDKRKRAHQRLLSLNSRVYNGFLQMEQATYCEGVLPKKTKELIATGISVVIDCESCMQWHIEQAAQEGFHFGFLSYRKHEPWTRR